MPRRIRKHKPGLTGSYYIEHRFRCLTEDEIGLIQALALDDPKWTRERLAKRYHVSINTIHKVVRAIPAQFVTVRRRAAKKHVLRAVS